MNLVIINHDYHYELENLVRLFFPNEKIEVTKEKNGEERFVLTELQKEENGAKISVLLGFDEIFSGEEEHSFSEKLSDETEESFLERKIAQLLFKLLKRATGYTPPWGILTGVRPAKLMTKLSSSWGEERAKEYFSKELYVSDEKISLASSVAKKEQPIIEKSKKNSFSLYVSIPFCPTRCSYCSFVSHSNESAKKLMPDYVKLLCKEIEETGKIAKSLSLNLESVYIGGGTPTALTADFLKDVTDAIGKNFNIGENCEYTIEAGRPDSVTDEKFEVIKKSGAKRISINPQTFSDSVLEAIGRKHTCAMTEKAMLMAREHGFKNINMDLIAGLPTDTFESFQTTLSKTLSFEPENITVHTLALKRSSTLVTEEKEKGSAAEAQRMLSFAFETLTKNGYEPYYMYRQSKCLGNLENVGWAKKGYECRYNVYMMEECHTVLACGAGAVTKLRSPVSGVIERIFNFKYPYEYISRFDELLERKKRILEFYEEL
ncbi:MAG: coproporphyrinogen dehydrogenase HemZ [Clostridia bacterium]|nr:coproporphyrinogen dehydrogenase HemZ [Clostridia bacterium]